MSDPITLRSGGWRYLIPNGLTATNLTFGCISCFYSSLGNIYLAGWFVLLAVCFDRVDGAAARALRATGKFGVEFDSLADLISFGLAPALMVFAALARDPQLGYAESKWKMALLFGVCVFWVLAAAFRLARFNVYAEEEGTKVYFGLPSPAGASTLVGGLLILMKYSGISGYYTGWSADIPLLGSLHLGPALRAWYPLFVALLAVLMVSGLKVPKMNPGRSPSGIYLGVNMLLIYIFAILRLFPEYLFFLALQVLTISVLYHLFWKSAKAVSTQPIFEAMSMGAGPPKPTTPTAEAGASD